VLGFRDKDPLVYLLLATCKEVYKFFLLRLFRLRKFLLLFGILTGMSFMVMVMLVFMVMVMLVFMVIVMLVLVLMLVWVMLFKTVMFILIFLLVVEMPSFEGVAINPLNKDDYRY
jgi:hypothetical protein